MPIEFRCTQCNKLLRTADDTAGKQAQCPECGAVVTIPSGTAGSQPPPPGETPFGGAGRQPPFPADSGNPYQSPSLFAVTAAARGPIAPGKLDFNDIFSRSWILFKMDWGMCLAAAVIVCALNFAVNMVAGFVPLVGPIVTMLFEIWMGIGLAMFFLKKARGQAVEISEVFKGLPYFGNILVASILVGVLMLAILAVCLIPAAIAAFVSKEVAIGLVVVGAIVAVVLIWYVGLVVSQFKYLVIDRNAGIIESLQTLRTLMEGNKLTLLLIQLVSGLIIVAATILTCGLGALVVAPYFAMMDAVIYLTITGQPTAEQVQPGPITSR